MIYDTRPIGVFDSGVGGISVLAELAALMPNEDFLYFGDSKNAPYGTKSEEEILSLSSACVDFLLKKDAKAIVIACNTATSVAADFLRKKYKNIPIIGIEPAVKPAAKYKKNSKIAVMATPVTLEKEKFKVLSQSFSEEEIIPLPCPGLAELIEQGKISGMETDDYLNRLFAPLNGQKIDSVVLGCTHYPFVKAAVKGAFPYEIAIFDGGFGTAKETKRRLECGMLQNSSDHEGRVLFFNSKSTNEEKALCKKLFKLYQVNNHSES